MKLYNLAIAIALLGISTAAPAVKPNGEESAEHQSIPSIMPTESQQSGTQGSGAAALRTDAPGFDAHPTCDHPGVPQAFSLSCSPVLSTTGSPKSSAAITFSSTTRLPTDCHLKVWDTMDCSGEGFFPFYEAGICNSTNKDIVVMLNGSPYVIGSMAYTFNSFKVICSS